MTPLQAEEIFGCLDRHKVRYVLIGGLAAVLHGSPLPTLDIDICPSREPENLERLAAALDGMDARIRTADASDGVPFPRDAEFLGGVELLNMQTRFGDLDQSYVPAGTDGFDDLARNAVEMVIQGSSVAVAALEDVIRSKEAADRPKDHRALPVPPATSFRDPEAARRSVRLAISDILLTFTCLESGKWAQYVILNT